mgnify:CR=1 FL=1
MINSKKLLKFLERKNLKFYTGVPDSVLKNFTNLLSQKNTHILASNEGSAVSIGIGYYLANKKLPCIYMQNSGLANAINPLVSVAHKGVYSIPLVMLIGWRGSPGLKDEPQHLVKGKITKNILKLLGIRFAVIQKDRDFSKISKLINFSKMKKVPVACLIKNNSFTSLSKKNKIKNSISKKSILRIDVLREVLKNISTKTKIISTTGYTSRELYQLRKEENFKKGKDFYMVGGMGHSSSVALGVSIYNGSQVVCLDGDGSMLMHLGSLHTIGNINKKNFKHILINNQSHESVGGQKISFERTNLEKITRGLGYSKYLKVENKKDLKKSISYMMRYSGTIFLEILVKKGSIKNLGRPKNFIKIKEDFLKK